MAARSRAAIAIAALISLGALLQGCTWPGLKTEPTPTPTATIALVPAPKCTSIPAARQEPSPGPIPGPTTTSTDGVGRQRLSEAATWRDASQGIPAQIGVAAVFIAASDPKVLYLAAYAPGGLYRSTDGGDSWRAANGGLASLTPLTVTVDAANPDAVWVGTVQGAYRTLDGGRSWQPLPGLPQAPIHRGLETLSVHAFALDPSDPRKLYAGTVEAVYTSADGGDSWKASLLADRPLSTLALLVDPGNPTWVYAGTTEGVYRSDDGGRTWRALGRESLDVTVPSLAVAPADPATLYAGTERQGLYRSLDGGENWHPWGPGEASVYAILVDRSGTIWLGTDQGIFKR